MIACIIVLADESARYLIGGLAQLDRLLRTLDECFAPALDAAGGPEVNVLWRTAPLFAERFGLSGRIPTRLRVIHRLPGPVGYAGEALVLRTNAVFTRGALARLIQHPEPHPAFAIAPATSQSPTGDGPSEWDRLSRLLDAAPRLPPPSATDQEVWILAGPETVPMVERQLFTSLGKASDGFVSRNFNRPISRRLSRMLAQTRLTPNHVSLLVLGVLALSTWTLARGTDKGFVLGLVLYHLANVLDGCDGEIARAKFQETRIGAWMDSAVDFLGNYLLVLAVAVGLARQPHLPPELRSGYLLEGVLIVVGISLGLWGVSRFNQTTNADDPFNEFGASAVKTSRVPALFRPLLEGAAQLGRRDTYVLSFLLLAVLRQPEWILHSLAIGLALHFPVIAWLWWKQSRVAAPLKVRDRH